MVRNSKWACLLKKEKRCGGWRASADKRRRGTPPTAQLTARLFASVDVLFDTRGLCFAMASTILSAFVGNLLGWCGREDQIYGKVGTHMRGTFDAVCHQHAMPSPPYHHCDCAAGSDSSATISHDSSLPPKFYEAVSEKAVQVRSRCYLRRKAMFVIQVCRSNYYS